MLLVGIARAVLYSQISMAISELGWLAGFGGT